MGEMTIRRLSGREAARMSPLLCELLIDCVDGGASVGFMAPFTMDKAQAFWTGVTGAVDAGQRALLVAVEAERGLVGSVQVVIGQPENQPHRADVSKLLVSRSARNRGVGAALMRAADAAARAEGKTLLVLDTATPEAERLYEREGWRRVGAVPGYALMPDGAPCDTTFFYKQLG